MAAERLQVILELVTGQYKKEAREAATSTKAIGAESEKTGGRLSNMSGSMKLAAAAAGVFVATRIVGFLGDSARAAAEDEKSQRLLALALENTTGATDAQIASNEVWLDTMARAKGVADDELRPALANLVRANGDVKQSQEELTIALDIAAARGLSVETVSLAMAKASNGNVGALGRMGIAVKDSEGKLLSYQEVLENASEVMGGAAAEAAETLEGRMKRLQISLDEAKESLGANLIPALTTGARTLGWFLAQMSGPEAVALERMQNALSQLADDGIDPFADRLRSATTVLLEANAQSEITTLSIEQLKAMFELTGPEIGKIKDYLKENADQLDLTGSEYDEIVGSLSEAENAWLHNRDGIGQHTDALELDEEATDQELAALKRLNDQVKIGIDLFTTAHDQIRSASDAMFNLSEKTDAQAVAQAAVNTAAETYGTDSPEYLQAVRDAAGANQDVDDALRDIVASGGQTRDEFILQQVALGLSTAQATLLADELDRINAFTPNPINYVVTVNGRKFGVDSKGTMGFGSGGLGFPGQGPIQGGMPDRASGGPVYAGQMYRAGEGNRPEVMVIPGDNGRVLSNADTMALLRGGRTGQNLNITIVNPSYTGNDLTAGIQRAVGLAGLVHFAEVTSGES